MASKNTNVRFLVDMLKCQTKSVSVDAHSPIPRKCMLESSVTPRAYRLLTFTLSHPGTLGLEIEETNADTSYVRVSRVIPNSQSDKDGVRVGDILCHADTDIEFLYNDFLTLAQSGLRPFIFNARRAESPLMKEVQNYGFDNIAKFTVNESNMTFEIDTEEKDQVQNNTELISTSNDTRWFALEDDAKTIMICWPFSLSKTPLSSPTDYYSPHVYMTNSKAVMNKLKE